MFDKSNLHFFVIKSFFNSFSVNQWTGFYMIGNSVVIESIAFKSVL